MTFGLSKPCLPRAWMTLPNVVSDLLMSEPSFRRSLSKLLVASALSLNIPKIKQTSNSDTLKNLSFHISHQCFWECLTNMLYKSPDTYIYTCINTLRNACINHLMIFINKIILVKGNRMLLYLYPYKLLINFWNLTRITGSFTKNTAML